jgi:hypothetical protein
VITISVTTPRAFRDKAPHNIIPSSLATSLHLRGTSMSKIKPITIQLHLADECVALLYSKWAQAYDDLKAVKNEQNDGSQDWPLFHAERLRRNTASEAKAKLLLEQLTSAIKEAGYGGAL